MMGFGLGVGGRSGKVAGGGGFDPTSLNLSGYWRADFAGAPWAGTASGGLSGTTGDLSAGNSPDVGSAVNGHTPATFIAANSDFLTSSADASTLFSVSSGTIVALFNATGADSPTGNIYDDAAIIRDGNADHGLVFTTNGLTAFVYSSGYVTKTVACSTLGWHLVMVYRDGTDLGIILDSAAADTTTCGMLTVMTGATTVGQGYGGTAYLGGHLLELMTSPLDLSASYANIKTYVNTRYGLSF